MWRPPVGCSARPASPEAGAGTRTDVQVICLGGAPGRRQ